VPGSVDVAETGDFNANARAIKAINPHSAHVNVTRVNGITTVLSQPTGGVITGQAAVIDLNGSTQAEMALVPIAGLVINYPRIAGRGFGGGGFGRFGQGQDFNELVRRRDQQLAELKKVFKDAENYARAREASAADKTLPFKAEDQKLDAMIPYFP